MRTTSETVFPGFGETVNQRFRCKDCGKTWIEERNKPIGDMRISLDTACLALQLLLEGMSLIRATERVTHLHRDTRFAI